jgi:protein involved in polysaccharide export with SLBB domain
MLFAQAAFLILGNMTKRLGLFASLCVVSVCLASTASLPVPTSLNFVDSDIPNIKDARQFESIALETQIDSLYVVGEGDFFELMLENLSYPMQVSPEGIISLEGVGSVSVVGITLQQAKAKILDLASKRYNPKNCVVRFSQIRRYRIPIFGAVKFPGQHSIDPQCRLSTLLRYAGGLSVGGNEKNILIFRGEKDTLRIDLTKKDFEASLINDPILKQGDRVWVPFFGKDQGIKVKHGEWSTVVISKGNESLETIVREAGYYEGNVAPIETIAIDIPLRDLFIAKYEDVQDMTIPVGSEIEILKKREYVYVGGSMAVPGRLPYLSGLSAMDYLASAGLIPQSGSFNQLKVTHKDGKEESIDPQKGMIYPGDYIALPKSTYETIKDLTMFITSLLSVVAATLMISASLKAQ